MFAPPPPGLTPSWQAGKVMGPLWLVCQQSSKIASPRPLPQPCSRWLTATKCYSTSLRHCAGTSHAGRRRRVQWEVWGSGQQVGHFIPSKTALLVVLCKQRAFFFGVLSTRGFSCWHPYCAHECNWLWRKRRRRKTEQKDERACAQTGYPLWLAAK